jgi:hypothetical protein
MDRFGLRTYVCGNVTRKLPVELKCYFFFLLQNQKTGGWNRSCLGVGVGTSERGEDV